MKPVLMLRWAMFTTYAAAMLLGSFFPVPVDLTARGRLPLDKLLHLVEYAGFALLFLLALGSQFPGASMARLFSGAVLLGVAYGCLDELNQMRLPARDSSLEDVLADGAGAVLGAFLWFRWIGMMGPNVRRATPSHEMPQPSALNSSERGRHIGV